MAIGSVTSMAQLSVRVFRACTAMSARRVACALVAVAACGLLSLSAHAQRPLVPPGMADERRRVSGDELSFCIHSGTLTAEFDEDLAAEVADVLLLEPEFHTISGRSIPYDYRIGLSAEQIFVYLSDNCEAFSGFTLVAGGYPDWLILSRPYLRSTFVLAVTDPDTISLSSIPAGAKIGTRGVTSADIQFALYNQSLPSNQRWRRLPYPDNELLIQRLLDGAIDAAIIWEPALYAATNGDPEAAGIAIARIDGFDPPNVSFSFGLRSRDTLLRALIDDAITALLEDGVVETLLNEHGIVAEPAHSN